MWWSKKEKNATSVAVAVAEEPKPVKWTATMKVTAINNHTDKPYVFESENNFGLTWDYTNDNRLLIVKQKTNVDGSSWKAKAHLIDFSMIDMVRQDFSENETKNI